MEPSLIDVLHDLLFLWHRLLVRLQPRFLSVMQKSVGMLLVTFTVTFPLLLLSMSCLVLFINGSYC